MEAYESPWYEAEEGEAHGPLVRTVRQIYEAQAGTRFADILHAALYGNLGSGGAAPARAMGAPSRLSLNVIRNMVGAVVSKIGAKNKPKPRFLTVEGDYEKRQQAELLDRFVDGVFYESRVYASLTGVFRQAAVWGTGALKVYDDGRKVCVEPTPKTELLVDELEGQYGEPPNLYQVKYHDRRALKKRWAKDDEQLAALIDRCPRETDDMTAALNSTADQVRVYEAWHVEDDGDGRHVLAIDGATLLDEAWDGPFPFAFLQWSRPLAGFWGVGLSEELMGIQAEINKLLQDIQKAHHLIKGHYLVEQGAKITTAHINNDLASIVKYTGVPPQYQAPQAIAPDVYSHLWQLYAKAFEIAGISQLNATGQKPAGLDSGAAQRAYQDIQTERFLELGQDYEEFVVEAARQVVRCAKRVGGDYTVRSVDRRDIRPVKWADIELEDADYVIRVFPTSMLPSTYAGKVQWAEDMIKANLAPPEDVLDIVDFPDTEAYARRRNAARRIVERNIASMLRGEPVTPEPLDNHALALRLVNEAYHEARLDGVPDHLLEHLRRYMADTQDFMSPPPSPPPPPGAEMPMGAGAPMPPPDMAGPMGPMPPMAPPPPMGPAPMPMGPPQ